MEGYDRQPDGSYARLELWTATHTPDPSALAPRFVRTMTQRTRPSCGGGWYATLRDPPRRIELTRLADGTRREWIPPEPYGVPSEPRYVSDHEMMLEVSDGRSRFLVRIDPHTLPVVAE